MDEDFDSAEHSMFATSNSMTNDMKIFTAVGHDEKSQEVPWLV